MARLRTFALKLGAFNTFLLLLLLTGCVLAEHERDFEFEDSDHEVKVVKRAASEVPLISDDEDLLADEPGSTPDEGEGSGTLEPPIVKPSVPGYPVFYRVTLNFTDLVYTQQLGDRNSAEFQELSNRLARAIELLFRNIQGQQLVTILQFSRGSVLVTLDLGSQGFTNPEALRSVLEEAVRSGLIGSYGVSPEGFTFTSLDEEIVCPSYVGREPGYLPRNGTNWANLLINNAFPCPGSVMGWEYYRLMPEGQAFVGVWRQVAENEFLLVESTPLPPAPVGVRSVLVPVPISVQRGDFIGIFYPRSTPNNVIAQATLADDVVPATEMYQNYYVQVYEDMVQRGQPLNVNLLPYQNTNATFAIRALMNYARDGVAPVYTCSPSEFTCDDGYCIQASYVCDNQNDCQDGSDERNCRTEVEPCLEGRFRCVSTGECITRLLRCDGKVDCPDRSDEQFCTRCRDNEFTCDSGQCIPLSDRCNGVRNCGDGTDELTCPPATCAPDEYRCIDGSCISILLRCDSRADCLDGDDEFQCPVRECRSGEFRCYDGTCIPSAQECDSRPDCPDISDEDPNRCSPFPQECPEGLFRCQDGMCINPDKRCNKQDDCADGSDEFNCVCSEDQFTCRSGECIQANQRCNRVRNCRDGSDEEDCPPIECTEDQFTCRSGECIRGSQRCNLERNCRDGSDEEDCPPIGCDRGDFQCANGECVDERLRCDGIPDCRDVSDEAGCPVLKIMGTPRVDEGEMIRVTCNLSGGDPEFYTITWMVDGEMIDPTVSENIDIRTFPMQEKGFFLSELYVQQSTLASAGIYSCLGPGQLQADFAVEVTAAGCRSDQFTCGDGQCVPLERRCDQRRDCQDSTDELNCSCGETEFRCRDGLCIDAQFRCNRRVECEDGSDEEDCPPRPCSQFEFTCDNGQCIDSRGHCNELPECQDGSDERGCPCKDDEFTCRSDGQCIARARRCDQRLDCEDRSDELGCECQENEFKCRDEQCIPEDRRCDRRRDCRDGSDEEECQGVCRRNEFRCNDGTCVDGRVKCDRFVNCADGSDEFDCVCNAAEFRCRNGQCIASQRYCDGRPDCIDGSDEDACPLSCRSDQFECGSRECIDRRRICDGRPDCRDRSDEANCAPVCREGEFACVSDGRCLPQPYVCNGRAECRDGSDEQNCPSCNEETEFQCGDGRCIPSVYRCNGRAECTDGSDESNCPTRIEVVITPQSLRVRRGQTAMFFCQASSVGSLSVRLRWSRSGGLRLPVSASDDSQGRLTLRNVAPEDAGNYICSVEGVAGAFQGSARLDVDYIGTTVGPTVFPPDGRCRADEATCSNGQCIPRDYLCDGEQDCSDGSDELSCDVPLPCEPNEFRCNNGRCAMKIWRCDGDNDCGDGSDESNCPTQEPGAPCRIDQFMCQRGDQCVPASYQCDGEVDCQDRSDEIGCVAPTIIKPPVPEIEVEINGTFTIYCEAVGVPTPLIVWRLNWGNIPRGDRVTVTSVDGRGTLVVRYARPEDAGAYTCEALNNRGSIFATPDALIIVRRQVGICQPPRFNFEAARIDECVRCFCFGHTETCYSSNLQISQITLGNRMELVRRATLLPVEEGFVQYIPSSGEFFVRDFNRVLQPGSYYWSLPRQYLGNRLTSYGGDLSYSVLYEVDGFDVPSRDPDVLIEGNGITLSYRRDTVVQPGVPTTIRVPLVESDWERSEGPIRGDLPISQYATRQDLMLALQNITRILVRATYDNRQTNVRIGNILLSTAVTQNTGLGRAVYVEDCKCPTGYTGLSCETCSPGFYRIQRASGRYLGECGPCNCNGHSNDCDAQTGVCRNCLHNTVGPYCDQCAEGYVGDARRGTLNDCEACPCPLTILSNQFSRTCVRERDSDITCTNCPQGYEGRRCERCAEGYRGNPSVPGDRCTRIDEPDICDTRGSLIAVPDALTGRCLCKANVEGRLCDRCRGDTFYLSSDYRFGCIPCFCMGVTQMCQSTSWNRAQVTTTFSSDRSDFSLTNMMQTRSITQGFTVDRNTRQLVYRRFNSLPQDVYYWNLPDRYLGDKVSAYGGNLRFTIRHRPGADSSPISRGEPIVEIGGNDIILVYHGDRQVAPNSLESFSIPFYETDWMRMDGEPANREHLLMALADLNFILIRATYTRDTDEAGLSDVSLDIAENRITGQDRAFAVEQCNCPPGYRGLSCEDCDTGYTRSGSGLYLGLCVLCQCNGHSNECDPETGVCRNCRHNTYGDNCELCQRGYYGDATRGSSNDCQKCPCPLTEPPNQFSPTCSLGQDGQVTCDACPVGHTGRRCESCVAGYQGNPLQPGDFCKQITDNCDCDLRGTIPNTQCDPNTRQCQCKAYVQGRRCGSCQEGYFHLDESNQQGCLECFCMGITNQCTSSTYYRDTIRPQFNPDGSHSFALTDRRMSRKITDGFEIDASRNEITFNKFVGLQRERESLFFQLPPKFRGDKVSSYGGYLSFTLFYSTAFDAGQSYMDVDVEIFSKDQRMYLLFRPPPKAQETQDHKILLRESSFRMLDGTPPTREQFLTLLADIDAFLIRATYNSIMSSVTLRNLEMDIAVPQVSGRPRTPEVESCRCPDGYTGLSCQNCAPGYLRVPDPSTALGRCTRCNCNGHATSCDPVTGRCMDCQHNTVGDRCERCAPGYYGDATSGTPNDCRECPCPLTTPSNRFSPTCFLDQERQVTCDQCPTGYSGRDCGTCAPGYTGNPREPGGSCVLGGEFPEVVVNPITLREPVGSTVRFTCQVSGRGPFNVLWSRLDGRPLPSLARTGLGPSYELVLNRVQYTDAGRYVCTATNAYGTNRAYVELTVERVREQLRVMIEEPRQIIATIGSSVRLVCVAVSYSSEANYVLSWSKDGGSLPARAIDQNGVLLIPNIQEGDAGQYTCTGSDPDSVDRATAVIRIQDIDQSPTARIDPRYLQVKEGDPIEFRCIVTGTPTPTVRWTRGPDGPLPDYATVQDGVFRIASVRKADESEYYCTATNPSGTTSVRTIIYVTISVVPPTPPTIIIRRAQITAVVGTDVQLECYAQEGGEITLVWSRQGGLPAGSNQDGGILNIPNIQPSYAGNYICTGTTPQGTIGRATAVVTVTPRDDNEAPTARVEPDMQTVAQGTTGTLRCIVTGKPRPTITWSRARGELTANHNVQGEILRITQATMEDRGIYICTVSNVAGRAMSSGIINIERRESPMIELFPETQQTLSLGGSALFQCRVTGGIPAPTITWTRAGGKEFTSTTKLMDGNGVVMFERVTGEEQGGYICTATNAVGTVTLTASLVIEGPPVITVTPGTRITAIVGERVNIECVGEGSPPPTVFWRADTRRRSDILPESYEPSPGTAGLVFDPVSPSDAGRYTCVARNDRGTTEENVDLAVLAGDDQTGVAPLVDIEGPDRLTLVDGQPVELTCTARGVPNPRVRWRRPGNQPLPPGHSVRGGTLYIPRITREYGGEYQCVVTSDREDYTASVIIIVTVTPRLSISPGEVTTRPGQSVTLRCLPDGPGPFQIEWQKVGGVLPPGVQDFDGELVIRQVTAADSGQYRCIATNNAGTSEGYASIIVQVPPQVSVTPKQEARQAGSSVEFRCDFSGDPPPTVRWEKETGSLPPQHQVRNGVLVLYNIQAEDEGRYICTAKSETGTARDFAYLRVSTAPDIGSTIGQSVQNVDEGDRVEFECIVTGTPRPTVTWGKLEGPLPSTAIIGEGILIIPEARPQDAGTYRCTATNVAGSVQSQVQLFVQSRPVISAQQDLQTAALGSPTTLSCETQGTPQPTITWTKKEGDLPIEHSILDTGGLYIPRVREEDAGTYECQASNRFGTSRLPIILIIGALVPYFPQNPTSYMTFAPLSDVYLDLDILLSFRPEATDGMLLYNGQYTQDNGDFVCFGLNGAYPEFRFDVGSGPAIIRGQNPLELNKWHTVHLRRQRKNGTLVVNDEPAYYGEAPGRFVGMDIVQPMYLGGVPNYAQIPRAAGFSSGFVGSVSQVQLKGVPINFGEEAVEMYGIEQYNACQDSPCLNAGRCFPYNNAFGFRCQCSQGFAGTQCETLGQMCYPDACGEGRCYDLSDGSGFRCICPAGYSGQGCQVGLTIVDPAFNKTSFISYPTIESGLLSVSIKLMFKPRSRDDGIVLYNAQNDDGRGDFVAIIMRDGFVDFRFDTGSGAAVLRSRQQIPINEWAMVLADRKGRDGMLIVNNEDPVNEQVDPSYTNLYGRRDRGDVARGTTSGSTIGLNLKRPLYLGGVDPAETISANVGTREGFVGCIAELMVNTKDVDLIAEAIESVNIADCGDRSLCDRKPCQNGAQCQDLSMTEYRCICPAQFTGKNCESEVNECVTRQPCQNGGTCGVRDGRYFCSCPLGFMGSDCEAEIAIGSNFEVAGDGFVEFDRALLPHRRRQTGETISLTVTTVEPNGVLFWQGQRPGEQSGGDYLILVMQDGFVEFRYELGSGPAVLTSTQRVDDGFQHTIQAERLGRNGNLTVDNSQSVTGASAGPLQVLNVQGNIFFGGVPDMERYTDGQVKSSFNGCIGNIRIQNSDPLHVSQQAVNGANVRPCIN